ncbi:condensation domain-containing protein [Brenneria rubrifaciens]|uniref:Condensation protein n=1 Tax=Brenneria rubrifaciens TaxID=55213 RepID=A0A4P8QNB6_9GAMM|nr:condensation domain-containing protein [Brenneria rubrifaciens]QCR08438.1 condensation protein [Brenneria rubrifaciens]
MAENVDKIRADGETRRSNPVLTAQTGGETAAKEEQQTHGQTLTAFEEQAWFRHQQDQDTPDQFALAWRLSPQIRIGRLVSALEAVLKKVPGLNVRYRFDAQGELRKFTVRPAIQPVAFEPIADEAQAIAVLLREQGKPCELHLEPPVRFLLFTGGPYGVILGAVAHGILEKQLSWTQILSTLTAIYNGGTLPNLDQIVEHGGLTEGIGLPDGSRQINLPWLYRSESSAVREIIDFAKPCYRHVSGGAAARYGTTIEAARLTPFISAEGGPQAQMRVLAALFGCYLSTISAGEEVVVSLPVDGERGDAVSDDAAPAPRLRQVVVRNDGRPLSEIATQAQKSLTQRGNGVAASGSHVLVTRRLEPSASLRLADVTATRIPLPPAHCSVDLALAVGDEPGESLSLDLITGPQVSPHIGGFLLEQFVAWLVGQTAALPVVVGAPAPTTNAPQSSDGTHEAEMAETILAELREALSSPQMGLDDDFFDYGGHSLIATRVIGRLLSLHQIEIHISDLFSHPTARGLAAHARRTGGRIVAPPAVTATPHSGAASAPLSLAQKSLWKAYAAYDFGDIFNIPFALRFLDPVDETAFRQALLDVLERHTGLRTLFNEREGEVRQHVVAFSDLPSYQWFGYSHQSEASDWRERLAEEAGYRFNLAEELPLRIKFIRDGASGQQILSMLFHHIVLDEWSVNLMMDELAQAYPARVANRAPVWNNQPAPFHEFAIAQHEAGFNQTHLDYWVESLRGARGGQPLFGIETSAGNGVASSSSAGGWVELKIARSVSEGLYRLAHEHSASLFNVVYAGIAATLHGLGAPDDLVIGTSASGRNDARFFDTIGYFTTVVAHRLRFTEGITLAALIDQVKNNINQSIPHTDIPIDLIEEALSEEEASDRKHMFEVFIQLHAKNKLNGCFTLPEGGRVAFRQVDPEKNESLLGLHFEVMEEVIDGETSIRVLMSYRTGHYDAGRVDLIASTLTATFGRLAEPQAGVLPLAALVSPPQAVNHGGEAAS